MKKFHLILIFVLGIFLMPSEAFACGKENPKKEKSCCSKEKSVTKTEKKSCCDKKNSSEKGCGGKCGHSNCTSTSAAHFSVIAFNEIEIKSNPCVVNDKKQNFFHHEVSISSGFHSLWLIPKIS